MHRRIPVAAFVLAFPLAAQAPTITEPTIQRTRTVWFVQDANPVGAEVGFAAEAIAWDAANDKTFASGKNGSRIALGATTWAELATFTDLKFGKSAVKAGNHYAVLEKGKDGWALALLDPDAVRKAQLAPGVGEKQPATALIALKSDDADASPLHAEWKNAGDGEAELTIRFGKHRFVATANVQGAKGAQPIALPDPRSASRVAFGKNAFAVIDHGVPAWNDERAAQSKQAAKGTRWRLGKDWATTLDTNTPLAIGDKSLAPGSWHLTLGRTDKGWNLLVSSAPADFKAKLDGFAAQYVVPVVEVPLTTSALDTPADKLQVQFANDGKATVLAIAFGPERLTVPVTTAKG